MQTLLKNTNAYRLLKADGESRAFHHAYLVLFDDSKNLRTAMKTFAKVLFSCDNPTSPAASRVANLIDTESFADCLFYPQSDKKFLVEDAERVGEECLLQPVEGAQKVFVIADFAEANAAAQNKLLKLLEEPPRGVVFLLGATTAFPVLPTVLSRVKKLEVHPFDTLAVAECLARVYGENKFGKDEFALCAAASGGNVGQAQGMLEGGTYKSLIDDVFALCLANASALPALIRRVGETKRKKEMLALFRLVFRDALLLKTGIKEANIFLRAERLRLMRVAEKYTAAMLVRAQDEIGNAEQEVAFNAVFSQCLEVLLAKINK